MARHKTTIQDIQELTDKLLELRKIHEEALRKSQDIYEEKKLVQYELIETFKRADIKSVKRSNNTVSLASRQSLVILDEPKLIAWLKAKKLDNSYIETRVNQLFKVSAAPQLAKEGTTPDGTQITSSEYISIRETKEKENGAKVK